jgi:hypothetical protein
MPVDAPQFDRMIINKQLVTPELNLPETYFLPVCLKNFAVNNK